MLTELDFSVHAIRTGFRLMKQSGEAVTTRLDELIATQSHDLLDQNTSFGATTRAQAFSKPTNFFLLRVLSGGTVLSFEYTAEPIPDDGKFNLDGLLPGAPS
jgi:hypothetical protein